MLETSTRLLRVLSLLQSPRDWTGAQLAERLGVTTRTVRNDIERLRALGYPVTATPGKGGGYRLGAGSSLPPLLFDDDEAVAVAVGLRAATGGGVAGIEESSLRALMKIEQVLPSRLRHRVTTLYGASASLPGHRATIAADLLTSVAGAIRDHERLRFDYETPDHATVCAPSSPICWCIPVAGGTSLRGTTIVTTGARSGSIVSDRALPTARGSPLANRRPAASLPWWSGLSGRRRGDTGRS